MAVRNKRIRKAAGTLLALWVSFSLTAQKVYSFVSPSQQIRLDVSVGFSIDISAYYEDRIVLASSPVSLILADGEILGFNPTVLKVIKGSVDKTIVLPFRTAGELPDVYNEMTINFAGDYGLNFRIYDDGIAYRFLTRRKAEIHVLSEQAEYRFVNNYPSSFQDSDGRPAGRNLMDWDGIPLNPPVVVGMTDKQVTILEAGVEDYPPLFFYNSDKIPSLLASHNKREDGGIALTAGTRFFPWRILLLTDEATPSFDIRYKLAAPSRVEDIRWIKPGVILRDTEGDYKAVVDYAAGNGVDYILLNRDWVDRTAVADLMKVAPGLDLLELIGYGRSRKVYLFLPVRYDELGRDPERIIRHYASLGVKGFRIDLADRYDQEIVDFIYRIAGLAATYQIMIEFTGGPRLTGIERTFPHITGWR